MGSLFYNLKKNQNCVSFILYVYLFIYLNCEKKAKKKKQIKKKKKRKMSDEESNQAMGTFATRESVVALETRLQNLEVMLTNLTQYFRGGQNNNFQQQRRVEVGAEPRQPNIPQGNFRLHRIQLFNEDSSEDDEGPVPPENNQGPRQIDYRMKIEIPQFDGLFMIEEFLDWLAEVEKFFDYWGTKEHMKVKLVAYRLKGGALAWWDQLQTTRIRQRKHKVRTWQRMRKLMIEHFLPPDYEQTLFSRYQHCRQANRTIHEYVIEFHKLVARVDVRETENQKISRFIDGLRTNIQDEVFK